jgi:hypothetical protein
MPCMNYEEHVAVWLYVTSPPLSVVYTYTSLFLFVFDSTCAQILQNRPGCNFNLGQDWRVVGSQCRTIERAQPVF